MEPPFFPLLRTVTIVAVWWTLFADPIDLSRDMLKLIKPKPPTFSERLSSLVPKLRNQFFHGTYLLSPDYLYLAFQMREIADALNTREAMANHPKIA